MSMAWLAVETNGNEYIYAYEPYRDNNFGYDMWMTYDESVELPKGSIKKLIGRDLTWDDDPVKVIIQH